MLSISEQMFRQGRGKSAIYSKPVIKIPHRRAMHTQHSQPRYRTAALPGKVGLGGFALASGAVALGWLWWNSESVHADEEKPPVIPEEGSCAGRDCKVLTRAALQEMIEKGTDPIQEGVLIDTTDKDLFEGTKKRDYKQRGKDLNYDFVVVGAGPAGIAAVRTLKRNRPSARILLIVGIPSLNRIDNEDVIELLQDKLQEEDFPVDFIVGMTASRVATDSDSIILEDCRSLHYNKLLLASGAKLQHLPADDSVKDKVHTLHSVEYMRDTHPLARLTNDVLEQTPSRAKEIAVVGGGVMGVQVARRLHKKGERKVHHIFKEPSMFYKSLPDYLAKWIQHQYTNEGMEVHPNKKVIKVTKAPDGRPDVLFADGDHVVVDEVLYAPTHLPSETTLGMTAGLVIDPDTGGLPTNEELRADGNLFIAGDAAAIPSGGASVSDRRRVATLDEDIDSGRIAAQNMLGDHITFPDNTINWIDLMDVGLFIESVGTLDTSLETVGWMHGEKARGAIFYLKDDTIVGAAFINFHSLDKLRTLKNIIATRKQFTEYQQIRSMLDPVKLIFTQPIVRLGIKEGEGHVNKTSSVTQ